MRCNRKMHNNNAVYCTQVLLSAISLHTNTVCQYSNIQSNKPLFSNQYISVENLLCCLNISITHTIFNNSLYLY